MLSELLVRHFRGIRGLELKEAAQVNLVIGLNDCGKTSLLEAIRILLVPGLNTLARRAGHQDGGPAVREADLRAAFFCSDTSIPFQLSGKVEGVSYSAEYRLAKGWHPSVPIETGETGGEPVGRPLLEGGEVVEMTYWRGSEWVTFASPLSGSTMSVKQFGGGMEGQAAGAAYSASVPAVRYLNTRRSPQGPVAVQLSGLARSGKTARLYEALTMIEPSFREIRILAAQGSAKEGAAQAQLEVQLEGMPLLPIESMGDGFISTMSIGASIGASNGGICLIDEVDNGIHYSYLSKLMGLIRETSLSFGTQVWAATHSRECVEAAAEAFSESPDKLLVHRLDRSQDGSVRIRTFTHDILVHALKTGLEVR